MSTTSFPKDQIKVLLLENIHPLAKEMFLSEGYQVETMTEALGEEQLKESADAGKFDDDFSWALAVRPWQDPLPQEQSVIDYQKLMPTQLYEIDLKVSFTADDRRERAVRLSTLRLGPKT